MYILVINRVDIKMRLFHGFSVAFCEETTTKTDKGEYPWPRTGFNSRAELPCKVGDSGTKAFYQCNKKGEWVDLDLKACKYSSQITRLLHELSMVRSISLPSLPSTSGLRPSLRP